MSDQHPPVRPGDGPIAINPRRSFYMSKVSPCLWFDGEAEQAAKFYVSLLPDSRIEKIQKNTVDSPAGKAGSVLVVDFTLAGQHFMALNGGMELEYTHAGSFQIDCADKAVLDR